MKKTIKIFVLVLCFAMVISVSATALAGYDRICSACTADSSALGLSRTGSITGDVVNVRLHHEVTSTADILSSACYGDRGVVSRVFYSDRSWYYVDFNYGNAKGHNGWVAGSYVNLYETR